MATVTGLTADRMAEIEGESVISGYINDDNNLILVQRDGTEITAGDIGAPGETGADGADGAPGSGVGPVLLGETVMTSNSATTSTAGVAIDWSGFSVTFTVTANPIYVRFFAHIKAVTANTTMVLDVVDVATGTVIIASNKSANSGGVSEVISGESKTLHLAAGTYTYKVQVSGTISGVTGVALEPGYNAFLKIIEQP